MHARTRSICSLTRTRSTCSSISGLRWSVTTFHCPNTGVFVMSRNTQSAASRGGIQLSIVVPLFNEVATIAELHHRLNAVLLLLGIRAEIVYVDDGSSDGTRAALEALAIHDERVVFVPLARNYGQTAALAAGFDAA